MSRLLLTALFLGFGFRALSGQALESESPVVLDAADRAEGVVTALEFPAPLASDTVALAACRLRTMLGAEAYERIVVPAFGGRLREPPSRPGREP